MLEWDSDIGLCCLIIQRTNSKEGNGVRDKFFWQSYFFYFNAFVDYILPYSFLFHPKSGTENLEYLQAGKQICFYHKYMPLLNSEDFLLCVFPIAQGK